MSRVVQSILNNTKIKSKLESAIVFFSPQKIDIEILNINTKLVCFQSHPLDINQKLVIINPNLININLNILSDTIICCDITQYPNVKSLSFALKLPQINIIREQVAIKKEMALDLARNQWINDINLVASKNIADQLYISNYDIISSNLDAQILEKVNNWKLI